MRRLLFWGLTLLLGAACGPVVGDDSGEDGTGGIMLPPASGASSGRTSGWDADATGELLDVAPFPDAPPFPEHCEDPVGALVVHRGDNPEGVTSIDGVKLVVDLCTSAPTVTILGSREDGTGSSWLLVRAFGTDDSPPFEGSMELDAAEFPDALEATMTFIVPFDDPNPSHANGAVRLQAEVVVQGGGWDLALDVDIPDCGDSACFCACE